ncbi:hypothetical protein PVAP13_5NG046208 [Panicum virgatum]|uniref:Translation machinery-associated protein 22 n=1 Tax=Panicum virgatum TaxID=38727 RepID=A0A8T0RJL7_PANVG|nr:hypothetical protein PVAP13_5NG046208 [Panicum virgatum]
MRCASLQAPASPNRCRRPCLDLDESARARVPEDAGQCGSTAAAVAAQTSRRSWAVPRLAGAQFNAASEATGSSEGRENGDGISATVHPRAPLSVSGSFRACSPPPDKQEVVIEKIVRNKRKCFTVVKGLELFGVKLSDASKKLGKKFATGASVVKGPTEKEQIDVQGDISYDIVEFITDTWPDSAIIDLSSCLHNSTVMERQLNDSLNLMLLQKLEAASCSWRCTVMACLFSTSCSIMI